MTLEFLVYNYEFCSELLRCSSREDDSSTPHVRSTLSRTKPSSPLLSPPAPVSRILAKSLLSLTSSSTDMSLAAVPDMLPTLLRRPGLTTWQVLNNDMVDPIHPDEFDSTGLEADELKKRKKYQATLWPNGKEAERGLDRCLRIYPHLQDTGAFFVAVLVKAGAPEVVVPAAVPA